MNQLFESAAQRLVRRIQRTDFQAAFDPDSMKRFADLILYIFKQCQQSPAEMKASAESATGFLGVIRGIGTRMTLNGIIKRHQSSQRFAHHQGKDRRKQIREAMLEEIADAAIEDVIELKASALSQR